MAGDSAGAIIVMGTCKLKPLRDGLGYCPACDPHARRPIPITARRRCYGVPGDPALWTPPVRPGVGTRLKEILGRLGIRESKGCRCREYARKLDTLGPQWCRENIGEIIDHLVAEANKRPWLRWMPFKRLIAKLIVLMTIRHVERSSQQVVESVLPSPPPPAIKRSSAKPVRIPKFDPDKRHVIHIVCRPGWQDVVRRAKFALGANFCMHELTSEQYESIERAIAHAPPGTIVCNHAFSTDTGRFLDLVRRYPEKRFIAINHCALNHAARWPSYFASERMILEATRELPNLWYACPDPNSDWKRFGYDKAFWWPNPVFVPEDREPRRVYPPCVAIVGRDDWMKGFASQVMAMAIMKQTMPELRLVAVISHAPPKWYGLELAKACGISLEMIPWMLPDEWYRFLRDEVSLVLQCSMAESFNYVSVDALIHGRPFVGSGSIRHTPPEWKAEPWQPSDIARVALQILDDYDENCRKALEIGRAVRAENNRTYRQLFDRILA